MNNELNGGDAPCISLTEVFDRCQSVETICSAWVNGEISSSRAKEALKAIREANFTIREVSGKPDNFDWDSLDPQVLAAVESSSEKYAAAVKLLDCTLEAIEQFEPKAVSKRLEILTLAAETLGLKISDIARHQIQIREPENLTPN